MRTKAARESWARVELLLGRPAPFLDDLVERHREPHRAYHTLEHVLDVLGLLGTLPLHDELPVLLAAWYHDAVYDPRGTDNEERSAELAVAQLSTLELAPVTVDRVSSLVLATKRHEPSTDPDTQAFLDADLAVLGRPPEQYDAYSRAIRQEYSWVPESAYRPGRGRVLEAFLLRPRLYQTAAMFSRFERQARDNLARERTLLAEPLQ